MFQAIRKRGLRGAIGLIVAYALVLQAALAYSIASHAAARGDAFVTFFVICTDDAAAMPDGMAPPVKPSTHCPICTLSGPMAATVPDLVALPDPFSAEAGRTPFVSAAACISFHQARSGLTRAPPQNA